MLVKKIVVSYCKYIGNVRVKCRAWLCALFAQGQLHIFLINNVCLRVTKTWYMLYLYTPQWYFSATRGRRSGTGFCCAPKIRTWQTANSLSSRFSRSDHPKPTSRGSRCVSALAVMMMMMTKIFRDFGELSPSWNRCSSSLCVRRPKRTKMFEY